ncbi:MAG: F0F1 ATP synthase subunit B [Chloroflexi bacterium]|jgi:F-type H+-transporting ATPase subunit b|nr:F0F1 ATP synthase subunit B [Chloroflexota bacterium]GIW10471.1 MAG: ATP synthase subunit B [Dehalococcoidia bacterium]
MDQLGINLPGLLAQIVNFLILFLILRAVLWPRVIGMLDERARRIRESMDRAAELQQQAAAAQQQFEEQLKQARQEAQEIVARALQTADRIKNEAEVEARQQADALVERARAEIQLERDRAIAELRREFADVTILAAERVIQQSLDKQRHLRLIEEVLAEVDALKSTSHG